MSLAAQAVFQWTDRLNWHQRRVEEDQVFSGLHLVRASKAGWKVEARGVSPHNNRKESAYVGRNES